MEFETPDYPMVLAVAAPAFLALLIIEWFLVSRKRLSGKYDRKDAITSMVMGGGQLISDVLMGAISLGVLLWFWQFRVFNWGFGIGAMLACLLLQDFVYWYKHMAAHKIRWFWSAHNVHHSSEEYNLSTAFRQPWNNHFTGFVLLSTPLVLLGFHPLLVGFIGAVNLVYQFCIHTQAIKKMPRWFEFIFNTPSHHRVHHGTNPRYLDSNYGGILIIWDRMFGTFVEERDDDPVSYGIITPIASHNPAIVAFKELFYILKDAVQPGLKLRQRLAYIFGPPGYSHDGSRKGSKALKADYVAKHPEQNGMQGL
ncbi:sterol desaturase family protein [Hellea balneolensis]|uniref:sterol desaturase family protein n=1 Tax=Hellea balneolensis TaxID=287478 RepID=UPI00041988B3|nr:sterol desaturase family protein [Hellea balneolensis]